jgi:hypothetical protein
MVQQMDYPDKGWYPGRMVAPPDIGEAIVDPGTRREFRGPAGRISALIRWIFISYFHYSFEIAQMALDNEALHERSS